jgi:formate dehydrogenase subunit beta
MIKEVRQLAKEWLESRKVVAILGLRENNGHVAPYLFTETGELESLVISSHSGKVIPRYFTSSKSQRHKKNIVYLLEQKYPKAKLGIVARGCDEKALIELAKRNQIDLEKITILKVACTKEDALDCRCQKPYPTQPDIGEITEGISKDPNVEALLEKRLEERLSFWKHELSKCIKCYGCRNVCPVCFCVDCIMEKDQLAKMGQLPPETPMFHLIRWYHVADRCIECGECEKACPVDIPLLTILKLLRRDIKEMFNYEAGLDAKQKAPLLASLDESNLKEK